MSWRIFDNSIGMPNDKLSNAFSVDGYCESFLCFVYYTRINCQDIQSYLTEIAQKGCALS